MKPDPIEQIAKLFIEARALINTMKSLGTLNVVISLESRIDEEKTPIPKINLSLYHYTELTTLSATGYQWEEVVAELRRICGRSNTLKRIAHEKAGEDA